jgi:hypothetical protein
MTPTDAKAVAQRAMKLWPTTINAEQAGVLYNRLVLLNVKLDRAHEILDAECATPTTAKIGRVAALVARFEAEHRQDRTTTGIVAGAEHPVDRLCRDILAHQARCRERIGADYARDTAWKLWSMWRNSLADAGMTLADAEAWLVENTEVEQAWVDALAGRIAAARARRKVPNTVGQRAKYGANRHEIADRKKQLGELADEEAAA